VTANNRRCKSSSSAMSGIASCCWRDCRHSSSGTPVLDQNPVSSSGTGTRGHGSWNFFSFGVSWIKERIPPIGIGEWLSQRRSFSSPNKRSIPTNGLLGADFVSKNRVLATAAVLHGAIAKVARTSEKTFTLSQYASGRPRFQYSARVSASLSNRSVHELHST